MSKKISYLLYEIIMAHHKCVRDIARSGYLNGKKAREIYENVNKKVPLRTIYRWLRLLAEKNQSKLNTHLVGQEQSEQDSSSPK